MKVCKVCGKKLPNEATVCDVCNSTDLDFVADTYESDTVEEIRPKSTVGMVLGIIGIVLAVIGILSNCCLALFGYLFCIIALVISIIALVMKNKLGIAGIAVSVLGLVFTVINSIVGALMMFGMTF